MMKRYFVKHDGRVDSECPIQNPVNPDNWALLVHEELSGSCQDYVRQGDSLVYSPVVKSVEETAREYLAKVQALLDTDARAQGYDDIVSACSYAGYPNAFQTEAISFLLWRSEVWSFCYAKLAAVQAGTDPVPTWEELVASLPTRT